MAPRIRLLVALAEDHGPSPSSHWHFTAVYNFSCRGSDIFFWHQAHKWFKTYMQIQGGGGRIKNKSLKRLQNLANVNEFGVLFALCKAVIVTGGAEGITCLPATNFSVMYSMLQVKRRNAFLSL